MRKRNGETGILERERTARLRQQGKLLRFCPAGESDVLCLQETKPQAGQIELDLPEYHSYWNYAEKKGYSGTAVLTKKEPLRVMYGPAFPNMTTRAV